MTPMTAELAPLPPDASYFDYLWGAERLAFAPAELTQRYHARAREVHPDRFTTRDAGQRALSVAHAEFLNQAYRTLKDPVERARYWLSRHGRVERQHVPMALAETFFELQSLLAEAASAGPDERDEIHAQLAGMKAELAAIESARLDALTAAFEAHDAGASPLETVLGAVEEALDELSYVRTMRRNLEAHA